MPKKIRCQVCGRSYDPNILTYSHYACPTCAFYARAHGEIYKEITVTITLQQAYNATICMIEGKKIFTSVLDKEMIDEALDALHGAIVTAFPQTLENRGPSYCQHRSNLKRKN